MKLDLLHCLKKEYATITINLLDIWYFIVTEHIHTCSIKGCTTQPKNKTKKIYGNT